VISEAVAFMATPQHSVSDSLHFYNPQDKNGWLSAFSDHPILLDGTWWPTVEHFFQGNKFLDATLREAVRLSCSPAEAKRLGQQFKPQRRSEWAEIKEEIMFTALKEKFRQHPDLGVKLVETSNAELIEDSTEDYYWGIGRGGYGANRLGCLLMKVRSDLQKEDTSEGA